MFREMRRKKQTLKRSECDDLLCRGSYGVLALHGDVGYPYAIPLSYFYDGKNIYFHCAKSGHKLEALQNSPKASFCVVGKDQIVPEEYTTYFSSVIVFGKVYIVTDEQEKRRYIDKLALKYAPNSSAADRKRAVEREWTHLCMLKLLPEHITGKQAIELTKR